MFSALPVFAATNDIDVAAGDDGKPGLHRHAVVGLGDRTCRGGRFFHGRVRPTLEVTLVETPARLRRHKRPDLGLALMDLSRSRRESVTVIPACQPECRT